MPYDTKQATEVITSAIEAIKTLKADVAAAKDSLAPLAEDNQELTRIVEDLQDADSAVDAKLADLAELLKPANTESPPEPVPVPEAPKTEA